MSKLIKPPSNFTTIPNHIINDKRLSFKAKGLFMYLISKSDGWSFSADRIKNDSKDGEDSILSGLSELEKLGLLTRQKIRMKGIFKGFDYLLSFDIKPSPENPVTVKPKREKPGTDKPGTEKPVHNKDSLRKKDIVIDERENIHVPQSLADYEIMIDDLNHVLPKDKEDERDNIDIQTLLDPDYKYDYSLVTCDFPSSVVNFLDELCKSKAIKNPLAYRSKILNSLSDITDKNHNRTKLAFDDFMTSYRSALVLPDGVSIFDLIGRA